MHSKRNSKVVPLRPRKAKIDKKYLVISSLLVILLFLFCFLKKSAYIVASETINRVYATEAVIVKNETLVNSPADGDLKLLVEAGERVRVNAPLFTLITDMEQKKIYEDELLEVDKKLNAILNETDQNFNIGIIDKSIEDTKQKLTEAVSQKKYDKTDSIKRELSHLTKEKQRILKLREDNIKLLEDSKQSIQKKINSVESDIYSPVSGIVSFNIDGYEQLLTPNEIDKITVAQIENIKEVEKKDISTAKAKGGKPVLKIVDNSCWYFVVDLKDNELKIGRNYYINLSDIKVELKAKLLNVYKQSGSSNIGVFLAKNDLPEIVDNRKIKVEILTEKHTGTVVPLSGIFVVDDTKGVYLKNTRKKVFKPIEVIIDDGKKAVVDGLKIGDTILIRGDLYDKFTRKFNEHKKENK